MKGKAMEFRRASESQAVVTGQEIDFGEVTGIAFSIPALSDWTETQIFGRSDHHADEFVFVHKLDVEPGYGYAVTGEVFPYARLKIVGNGQGVVFASLKA
ncbi:MAG: hypothetical protein ACC645_23255 [Pirellulales bacterium]